MEQKIEMNTESARGDKRAKTAVASDGGRRQALSGAEVEKARKLMEAIADNIETVIIGKREVIDLVILTLISRGHVLIEDVPGVGKTSLVSALARSLACDFKRIQFTPDTMPSDVTGFSVYNQKSGEFEFRPGSVMSQIVLADEINRASAKTQASLLEAMEERQVTVDSRTYRLTEPFMVLATQNPVESFGTYPLPEAQIDRFMVRLSIGYPSIDEEVRVVSLDREAKKDISAVASAESVIELQNAADKVFISEAVARYIIEIVAATRTSADVLLGSSPRGGIALYNFCKAYALYKGRDYVIPDDVKYLAPFVLAHRIILSHEAKAGRKDPEQIIKGILQSVLVPSGEDGRKSLRLED